MNYVLDDRSIVFRTGRGRKLRNVMEFRPAVLEIDGYEPGSRQGSQRQTLTSDGHAT